MSILDKVVAALTPTESDEARIEARSRAQQFVSDNQFVNRLPEPGLA